MGQITDDKILRILRKQSMNTLEVAAALKVERHTAIKYLEAMESKGLVSRTTKRRAKIWSVSALPAADVLKRKDVLSRQLAEILDTVDQHISIQDRNYEIIYRNVYAKSMKNSPKCHEAYFNKEHRCPNCPVEKTFRTGKPQIQEEMRGGKRKVIITKPLKDDKDKTIAVVEIMKDAEKRN